MNDNMKNIRVNQKIDKLIEQRLDELRRNGVKMTFDVMYREILPIVISVRNT